MKRAFWARANALGIDDAEAAALGREMERLAKKLGRQATNEELLEAAGDEKNPFHRHVQWDSGRAARLYQLDQISRASLVVGVKIIREEEELVVPYRQSVIAPSEEPGEGPRRVRLVVADALNEEESRLQMLRELVRRVYGYRSQLACHPEAEELVAALDALHEGLFASQEAEKAA